MKSRANENGPEAEPGLAAAVERCRKDTAALADLQSIYARVDRAAAEAGLSCLGGGGCCRFDLTDHRVYASGLELALLTAEPPPDVSAAEQMRCPYQQGPACAAYPRRPLGCRTFFCRPEKKVFLEQLHERYHCRIRRLHQSRCIPYAYAELTRSMPQLYILK